MDVNNFFDGSSTYTFGQIKTIICNSVEEQWKLHLENVISKPNFQKPKTPITILEILEEKLWELVPRIKRVRDMDTLGL